MERRTFLSHATAAATLGLLGCQGKSDSAAPLTGTPTPVTGTDTGTPATSATLPIPPELTGTMVGARRVFELTVQSGSTEFFPGQPADTMGYNGALLGPTIRAHRGEPITIRVTNNLQEPTTTHFHGAHLPAAMDGGPHQVIAAGQTWESIWDVDQPAATIWYHPHLMGQTARQVYFGMAGLFLIDDADTDALDLPDRYGIDDLPLVIQDRRFQADGQLDYTLTMPDTMHGFNGNTALVNGAIQPHVEVEAKHLRLRMLNGCNGRVLQLTTSDGTPLQIVATDQSLTDAPIPVTALTLSPGERVEVVIDLTDRLDDVLFLTDTGGLGDLLEIRVTQAPTATHSVPASLATVPRLDPADAQRTRPFALMMTGMGMGASFEINGETMDMAVINEVIPVDEVEIWEISNTSNMVHNFHMHATYFEVLDRNGASPEPWEMGLKDTVTVESGHTVRVLVKHTDYTDPVLPYMYHCHILEHEDAGMMGQFTVVAP